MQSLQLPLLQKHIENHKAYIQSWISVLKNEPNELFLAIHEAERIEQYALEKGGISKEKLKPDLHKEKQAPDKKQESREKPKSPRGRER